LPSGPIIGRETTGWITCPAGLSGNVAATRARASGVGAPTAHPPSIRTAKPVQILFTRAIKPS
jgi:hypothetical protein